MGQWVWFGCLYLPIYNAGFNQNNMHSKQKIPEKSVAKEYKKASFDALSFPVDVYTLFFFSYT